MIAAIKRQAADALTFIRLIGSCVCAQLILTGHWTIASWMLLPLVATDVLDGIFARRWSLHKRWHDMSGKTFNELASGMLSVLVPGAMLIRFGMADLYGWAESGRTQYWGSICGVFLLLTAVCIWFRNSPRPTRRMAADAAQGWLFGFLMIVTAVVMVNQPYGYTPLWKYGVIITSLCALLLLSWERIDRRPKLRRRPR